jgi:hypothetical protein
MADATFTPGYQFVMNLCLRFDCINRNKKCKECIKYDRFKEKDGTTKKSVRHEQKG